MTKRCLKSVFSSTFGFECRDSAWYETILVDDCSNEVSSFEEEFQSSLIQVIRNEKNLGFARSCNRGAAAARGRHLVFLNNDTIALRGWLEELVRTIEENPSAGIVGSKLLYPDETIQHAGVVFDENKLPFHIYRHFPSAFSGVNKKREFQAVTGACFIIRSDLFRILGGFDERYLNGLEDIDLCLRVREAGHRVLYCPNSCLYHLEYQTRKRDEQLQEQNVTLFMRDWSGKVVSDFYQYYLEDLSDCLPDQMLIKGRFGSAASEPVLVVWGAGSGGRRAAHLLRWIGFHPGFFVDNAEAKWDTTVEGLTVKSPEYLLELKSQGREVFIIVASMWFREIMDQLVEMGFEPGTDFLPHPIVF